MKGIYNIGKAVCGWGYNHLRAADNPKTHTYAFFHQKPMKLLGWGAGIYGALKVAPKVFDHGVAPSVSVLVGDAAFGEGATMKAVDKVKDAAKDVKEGVVSMKESAKDMKENVSSMMHSTGQQMPQGGYDAGFGSGYGAGGYDGYGGYGMNAAAVRQQEAAIWNTGAQLGGDSSLLGGMGTMLSNFLSGNALRLAALPIAAFMLFGRHGWMTRIAGLLLGGTMMRQLSAPAIAPSVNNAIDNVQRRYSAPAADRQPAVQRSGNPAYDAAAEARLQYAQSQDYDEDESQYVVQSRRA